MNRCAPASFRRISSIQRESVCMLERQSALAAVLRQAGRSGSDGSRALRLGEVRGWNLVQVAAFASTTAELERVVSAALGVASLPPTIGMTGEAGARRIFR